jgi:NAD+ synthase
LDSTYDEILRFMPGKSMLPHENGSELAKANLKPRLRMASLYFVANTMNYLVAGTGNRSELLVGYFTKYGDGGVDLLPLGGLVKSEVRRLARELGVPERIITKPPSAGLWDGQTDETEMGFTYEALELYLDSPANVDEPTAARIAAMMKAASHKLEMAPVPPSWMRDAWATPLV